MHSSDAVCLPALSCVSPPCRSLCRLCTLHLSFFLAETICIRLAYACFTYDQPLVSQNLLIHSPLHLFFLSTPHPHPPSLPCSDLYTSPFHSFSFHSLVIHSTLPPTRISLELAASNLMFLILHGLKPWQIDFSPFLPTYSWDLTTSPLHFFSPLPAVTHSQTLGQAISVVLVDCCCIRPMLYACQPCPVCPPLVVHCVVSVHSIFRSFLLKPFALDSPTLVLPMLSLSSRRTC